jgi:hypothetical protein
LGEVRLIHSLLAIIDYVIIGNISNWQYVIENIIQKKEEEELPLSIGRRGEKEKAV